MSINIFVSYAHQDANFASRIADHLRQFEFEVWVDQQNLPHGADWVEFIERSIRQADAVVVLMSPQANASQWTRREILFAEQHNVPVYPVLIAGDERSSIPIALINRQWLDLRSQPDEGMDALARTLLRSLDPPTDEAITAAREQAETIVSTLNRSERLHPVVGLTAAVISTIGAIVAAVLGAQLEKAGDEVGVSLFFALLLVAGVMEGGIIFAFYNRYRHQLEQRARRAIRYENQLVEQSLRHKLREPQHNQG